MAKDDEKKAEIIKTADIVSQEKQALLEKITAGTGKNIQELQWLFLVFCLGNVKRLIKNIYGT